MTRPYKIIQDLAATNSRLEKIAILKKAAAAGHNDFFAGVRLALDKDTKFFVKQVPEKDVNDPSAEKGLSWNEFVRLADMLSSRQITGSEAKKQIIQLMNQADLEEWNLWYRPILRKDLRCGFDLSTLNTALGKDSEYYVHSFKCMLASDSKDRLEKVLSGRKALDIKYDGVRTLAIYEPGKPIVCYSRNGKVFRNFTKIEASLASMLKGCTGSYVFDGEVVSSSFNSLMTQVNRKTNANADDALYVIFDCVPLADFRKGFCAMPYANRQLALGALVDHVIDDYANVTCTTPRYIDFNAPNSMEQFETLKRYVLDAGYEGLIVKDPEAGYYCKRHDAWMKIKPFIEVSLTIVDVNEGEKGTKREGFLGALVCEGVDDDKQIRVNVGSGFTDEMLVNFWLNRPKLIGMIAEVRADAISQNADGGYSLRFPRFKCFRGFKKGEKL